MPAFASAEKSFDRPWPVLKTPAAARGAAAIFGASLALAALLVAERRASGALVAPLGPLSMGLTAAVAVLFAAGFRVAWRTNAELPDGAGKRVASWSWLAPTPTMNRLARFLPAAALALLGVSLWLPDTSLAAIVSFWSIAVAEGAWGELSRRRRISSSNASAASHAAEKIELHIQPAAPLEFTAVSEVDFEEADEIDHEALEAGQDSADESAVRPAGHAKLAGPHYEPPRPSPAGGLCDPPHLEPAAPHFGLTNKTGDASAPADERIVQQLTRSTTRDGVDMLRGSLHATFPPGLRTLSIHVAFCPPFAERPRMEFRQTSGPTVRIKLAQLLAFGARFDVKLAALAQADETVVLEISAAHP